MLMASGNDAAYTVAVTTARAVKTDTAKTDAQAVAYFSELMNSYASSIGMKDSRFAWQALHRTRWGCFSELFC